MWKLLSNPDAWQQVVYRVSYRLPAPARRLIRQEILWRWLYPAWWRYHFNRWMGGPPAGDALAGRARYMTIVQGPDGGTAGIGDQISKWNTALVLALRFRLKVAHHPFVRWWDESGWDEWLGFGEGERRYQDVMRDPTLKKVYLPPLDLKVDQERRLQFVETIVKRLYPQDGVVFHLGDGTNVYDHSPSAAWLRAKYWQTRARRPLPVDRSARGCVVALHVRRGDLREMKRQNTKAWRERWLPNRYFVRVVAGVREALAGQRLAIHVYSQGVEADFPEFRQWSEVHWHLDEDLKLTWHGFVTADVLVTSPSSLSYHAGFLNAGVKIAKWPWWHHIPETDGWVRASNQGEFDLSAFQRAIRPVLDRKETTWPGGLVVEAKEPG